MADAEDQKPPDYRRTTMRFPVLNGNAMYVIAALLGALGVGGGGIAWLQGGADPPALAAEVRELKAKVEELKAEENRWCDAIENITKKYEVDGSGCDSGDPLDLMVAEIRLALTKVEDERDTLKAKVENLTNAAWNEEQAAKMAEMKRDECREMAERNCGGCKDRAEAIALRAQVEAAKETLENVKTRTQPPDVNKWEDMQGIINTLHGIAVKALSSLPPPDKREALRDAVVEAARKCCADWCGLPRNDLVDSLAALDAGKKKA